MVKCLDVGSTHSSRLPNVNIVSAIDIDTTETCAAFLCHPVLSPQYLQIKCNAHRLEPPFTAGCLAAFIRLQLQRSRLQKFNSWSKSLPWPGHNVIRNNAPRMWLLAPCQHHSPMQCTASPATETGRGSGRDRCARWICWGCVGYLVPIFFVLFNSYQRAACDADGASGINASMWKSQVCAHLARNSDRDNDNGDHGAT